MSFESEHDGECCAYRPAAYSVHQTLDEMAFERGVWSAALDGELDRVQMYISRGGDVNAVDRSGYVALHYAARNGHLEICQTLVENKAKVNFQTRAGGATALHRAAYRGHTEIVRLLLDNGANVRHVDSDGQTALHKAANSGKEEMIEMLIETDPDLLSIKDKRGKLPQEYAAPDSPARQLLLPQS